LRASASFVAALLAPVARADELDDAHKKLRGRGDLQFEFTVPQERPRPPANNWFFEFLDALGPVFNLIFWIGLAAIVLMLAFFIGREVLRARYGRDDRKKPRADVQETSYQPAPEKARALLDDADRLAAQGLYDEAVRTLLHRSIDDIEQRSPRAIRPAQTSREIARLSILPPSVRAAFDPLVRAVERSWFGGLPLDNDGYQACRKSYADFALPEAWQ
jgi:hypothetical protein